MAIRPVITVKQFDSHLAHGVPWQVAAHIGDTDVVVRIGGDGNLTLAAENASGAEVAVRPRHVDVAQLPPIGDDEIIDLSACYVAYYTVIGRYASQTAAENLRDQAYWIVVYARARQAGQDHERAKQVMQNGMADEAQLPRPFPEVK